MRWKKYLLHGVVSSILTVAACIIYMEIYQEALGADFSAVVNTTGIIGASVFGCTLMALGYALVTKWSRHPFGIGSFNLLIAILSLASIIGPLSMSLPLDIEAPELFPGLTIPMHFFPAIAFFAIAPFFSERNI